MSALDELIDKQVEDVTDLEFAIIVLSEIRQKEAEEAAAELAEKDAWIADLESALDSLVDFIEGETQFINCTAISDDVLWLGTARRLEETLNASNARALLKGKQP